MGKLSKKTIWLINKYDINKSDDEIAKELWVSKVDVSKIRKEKRKELFGTLDIDSIEKLKIIQWLSPKQVNEILYQNTLAKKDKTYITTEESKHAIFGAIWDTHLWSKQCNYDGLNRYYDIIKERWIDTVFHSWDIVDGHSIYKWQEFELDKHSMDEQISNVVDNYPKRDGITTNYILWNHDEAWLKIAWYDISKQIDLMRSDLKSLGWYNATVDFNGLWIELHHWGGGNAYSLSYKPQKYLEWTDPFNQPDCYLLWHFHTAMYMFYRKIHAFMVGSFQWETLLSKRFKLGNTQGWWIIELRKENGETKIKIEFINVK